MCCGAGQFPWSVPGVRGLTVSMSKKELMRRSRMDMDCDCDEGHVNMELAVEAAIAGDGSMNHDFGKYKKQLLNRTLVYDKSPKGSVDARIIDLVREVNRHEEFATAQSCSGKVLMMACSSRNGASKPWKAIIGANVNKVRVKQCHDGIVDADEYFCLETEPLRSLCADGVHIWLKVEPFDLDVDCATEPDARRFLAISKTVYSRRAMVQSVIEGSKRNTWRINIHGNQRLEMPLTFSGKRVYSGETEALANIVNAKLAKNWALTDKLLQALRDNL